MWTRLANWLVQDGEIPELRRGAQLHAAALRVTCTSSTQARPHDAVTPLGDGTAPGPVPAAMHEVTGTVLWLREPASVALQVATPSELPFGCWPSRPVELPPTGTSTRAGRASA